MREDRGIAGKARRFVNVEARGLIAVGRSILRLGKTLGIVDLSIVLIFF